MILIRGGAVSRSSTQWLEMVKVCGGGGGDGAVEVAEWTGNIREKRKYGRIAAGEATRLTQIVVHDRSDHI